MEEEKRLRLAALLLQGLTVDEAQELTTLLIEEREEWYVKKQNEVKNLTISDVRRCVTFYPDTTTTSATKCKFCGKEKYEH